MGLFDRFIMVLYTLALVVLAILVAAVAAGWQAPFLYWDRLLATPQERWIVVLLALAVALIGLRSLFATFAAGPPAQALVQTNAAGEVHVSLHAIEHIVGRLARQVRGIREVRPRIRTTPGGVAVFVEAVVQPDTPIPQASAELQERVRQKVEEMVGIPVLEVKVLVESVLRERARVR